MGGKIAVSAGGRNGVYCVGHASGFGPVRPAVRAAPPDIGLPWKKGAFDGISKAPFEC